MFFRQSGQESFWIGLPTFFCVRSRVLLKYISSSGIVGDAVAVGWAMSCLSVTLPEPWTDIQVPVFFFVNFMSVAR